MIRLLYPPLAVAKAHALAREVEKNARDQRSRDTLSQQRHGLTHRYLSRVGTVYRQPSNRTLDALGFDLILRDRATGEEELVPWLVEEA